MNAINADELLRAWKINRWPGGLPRAVDWSDVETAFRAGLFQGQAGEAFAAKPALDDLRAVASVALQTLRQLREGHLSRTNDERASDCIAMLRAALNPELMAGSAGNGGVAEPSGGRNG